ncbi:response regulator [Mucilaginibacter endophyticus]|uniref:response regulator n=1 Tax=Mucilaginibacter endophyticus TaxID=2675003 RepID=UPI000E0D995A|nr:response regulator [Mucilaginibacter endophyticus]
MDFTEYNPKILLIDDAKLDTTIFKLVIRKVLGKAEVSICENGKVAIEFLQGLTVNEPEKLPDFIFLDLRMPVMNGWEFLKKYESLKIDPLHKSKIYILSSSVDQTDVEKSIANPRVKDFLSKPIHMGKLQSILK